MEARCRLYGFRNAFGRASKITSSVKIVFILLRNIFYILFIVLMGKELRFSFRNYHCWMYN